MSSLEQQVKESATSLQQAWAGLQKAPTSASLPAKCYEHWRRRASLHDVLSGTVAIFEARELAWKLVDDVSKAGPIYSKDDLSGDPTVRKSLNAVMYGNIPMEFVVARHLALAAYVSVTWSIYDRVANVCGRLAGVSELAENPKQNPKACEDFLGKKDILGFASHLHIREGYSWPLKVTYKIRNWLLHEGYEEGGTPLFEGSRIQDGFLLAPDAVQHLQRICDHTNDNGKIGSCCVAPGDTSWGSRDLLRILELYHREIDMLFMALLKWSVESFVGQVKAFAARDQA
jgi:hypothetical protein